jgi:hypothetical protein
MTAAPNDAGGRTPSIAFLIEVNRLKNSIIALKDFDERVKALGRGIIGIYGTTRVVYYRPLPENRLHAVLEFIAGDAADLVDGRVEVREGHAVRSAFNPAREISENENMYMAALKNYFFRLKTSASDPESTYVLMCIKDEGGRPAGYFKVEWANDAGSRAPDDAGDDAPDVAGDDAEGRIPDDAGGRNEAFVDSQRRLLARLKRIIEGIEELAGFVTLGTLEDPYGDFLSDDDNDGGGRLASFGKLAADIKAAEVSERFRLIPELIGLLRADSIRLYSIQGDPTAGVPAKTPVAGIVGLWNKDSNIPTPIYKSSFIKGGRVITNGDSLYFAALRGYDLVLDAASSPKCLVSQETRSELSNVTSYIIVRLDDAVKKPIGFLQVNYVFKGDPMHPAHRRKLRRDLEILRSIAPYFTSIPSSGEFTHDADAVIRGIQRFMELPPRLSDNDAVFQYIADTMETDISIFESPDRLPELPELIDHIKKFSYFVTGKRAVIAFFKWLYGAVPPRLKPLVVSAISVIYEHFTMEQGRELSIFSGDCYDTLAEWTGSRIKEIISDAATTDAGGRAPIEGGRDPIAGVRDPIAGVRDPIAGVRDPVETLEQLLQLNCLFASRYRSEDMQRCMALLEAMNIYETEGTDFLSDLFALNPAMPEDFKREIFRNFYHLISNDLLDETRVGDVLALCLSEASEGSRTPSMGSRRDDHGLLGQILSTAALVLNRDGAGLSPAVGRRMGEFEALAGRIIAASRAFHDDAHHNRYAAYTAALILLMTNMLKNGGRLDLAALEKYVPDGDNAAVIAALRDYLLSHPDDVVITDEAAMVKLMLSGLKSARPEVADAARDVLLHMGGHISGYDSGERAGAGFMSLLINELSSGDINYKLTIHDILYTLKAERMERHSIHSGPAKPGEPGVSAVSGVSGAFGPRAASRKTYITAVSSTLGFTPFDIGEKGYHLVEMIGRCRIPVFLLLKTAALDDFLSHNSGGRTPFNGVSTPGVNGDATDGDGRAAPGVSLGEAVKSCVEAVGFDHPDGLEGRILDAGRRIGALISDAPMPQHMELELVDKFVKFKEHVDTIDEVGRRFVTIGARSTAKGEDGRLYSYAGQFLSVLDIKTPQEFLTAIKRIWASLWSPKAISYRHDIMELDPAAAGIFSHENLGMGVVIQGVVEAAASGVIMTLDNGGMVVSGSVGIEGGTRSGIAADKYTLDLHAAVTEKIISPQPVAVLWDRTKRVFQEVAITDPTRRNGQKVPDSQLKILFEIVERLKKMPIFIGLPLDIEYAVSTGGGSRTPASMGSRTPASDTIFITQIRPRTTGSRTPVSVGEERLSEGRGRDAAAMFSGLSRVREKRLQTFAFGAARGPVVVLDAADGVQSERAGGASMLEKLRAGDIVVAGHLDLPDLEVYLKRRPPGAIILEMCTPFAHPVLVVSEMERRGARIPIVQMPRAVEIFKSCDAAGRARSDIGSDIGVEVLRENYVSFYISDAELIKKIEEVESPFVCREPSQAETGADALAQTQIPAIPIGPAPFDVLNAGRARLEEIAGRFMADPAAIFKLEETRRVEAFKDLTILSHVRRVEIERLLENLLTDGGRTHTDAVGRTHTDAGGRTPGVEEETVTELYAYILQRIAGRHSAQYEMFCAAKIKPCVEARALADIEERVLRAAALSGFLRDNFGRERDENLWSPGLLPFQLNSPVFLIDPESDSGKPCHDPSSADLFNPWEFPIVMGAQSIMLHDQLAALAPFGARNRCMRGRVCLAPDDDGRGGSLDLGFLDNTGEVYNTLGRRRRALAGAAGVLVRMGFAPETVVDILPRMTEDFEAAGIPMRTTLAVLYSLHAP